ncbi:MAG: DNA mismatch repair endonuclease MutL [Nitrospinae bacterium]|nr:DNA mismatch repair endonuclease MutL [Nitrospinota bacterium]
MDGIITILPDEISNRLAAGEVVERPASVVKELIENAIDAGSDKITVEVSGGNRGQIIITDNGTGMIRDDAVLSLQRHATSKIKSADDIFCITTLGFRGEALPSIASVSKLKITTFNEAEEVGTAINIEGGKITDIKDAPPIRGTSIEVSDIFFNVPARQKFLSSETTELSHIQETVIKETLANPAIGFKFIKNKKVVFDLPATNNLKERIAKLFGSEIDENLIRVEHAVEGKRIFGFISKAGYSRKTRDQQFLFLNNRNIRDKVVNHAVYEGLRTLFPRDRHPVYFLFLDVDPTMVDVNVHPTKLEVKFADGRSIHSLTFNAVRFGIKDSGEESTPIEDEADQPTVQNSFRESGYTSRPAPREAGIKEAISKYMNAHPRHSLGTKGYERRDYSTPPLRNSQTERTSSQLRLEVGKGGHLSKMKIVGQIYNTFIILEGPEEMMIVDQHTAHERILYEKFMDRVNSGQVDAQEILFPARIEVSADEKDLVEKHLETLMKLGFKLEHFGGQTFTIRTMPVMLKDDDPKEAVRDLIDSLKETNKKETIGDILEKMITIAACRAAVKAADKLTMAEMEHLLKQLEQCRLPFTCPHGRPIVLTIDRKSILNGFLRQ